MNTQAEIRHRVERLKRYRASSRVGDRSVYDWYAESCPHGLPPGECREHPRARAAQRPPAGRWRTWAVQAGRAFGKTRTAAEWVRNQVERHGARRVALVAPTAADARDVMVEGESGILNVCPPWNRPVYEPSKRRLTWPNGAIATMYSADVPERLRGPQSDRAWIDEVQVWSRPAAFDMMRFGLRLGTDPRVVATFTPRPTALVKKILAESGTVRTGGTTYENRLNLAQDFIDEIVSKYEGTRLGRQEIHAELLEILEGQWFTSFDPARHVSDAAEFQPGLPVRLAVDCGVSGHTGAVFFQVREVGPYRRRVNVFGDYYKAGLYSEANAEAIKALAPALCRGQGLEAVRLDPAASAHTGVGPAAYGEYERIFGRRLVAYWPQHGVVDGLDTIELLLGPEGREPDLLIHPRAVNLIGAFNGYSHAERAGQFMPWPRIEDHPYEDLMDALRGGIRDALPGGRRVEPNYRRVRPGQLL